MKILGWDISMNSPGICLMDTDNPADYKAWSPTPVKMVPGKRKNTLKKHPLMGTERIVWHDYQADKILSENPDVDLIVLENYSFGKTPAMSRLAQIGEATGVWKKEAMKRTIPLIVVAPQSLKKFNTGKGTGGKDPMFALNLHKKWKDRGYGDCDSFGGDDEIDAFLLSVVGHMLFCPELPRNKYHNEVLKVILDSADNKTALTSFDFKLPV